MTPTSPPFPPPAPSHSPVSTHSRSQVVFFETLYDSYLPMVRRVGGVPRIVQLHPPGWSVDAAELEAAFSPRTALVVLNSPHNPTGKVSVWV